MDMAEAVEDGGRKDEAVEPPTPTPSFTPTTTRRLDDALRLDGDPRFERLGAWNWSDGPNANATAGTLGRFYYSSGALLKSLWLASETGGAYDDALSQVLNASEGDAILPYADGGGGRGGQASTRRESDFLRLNATKDVCSFVGCACRTLEQRWPPPGPDAIGTDYFLQAQGNDELALERLRADGVDVIETCVLEKESQARSASREDQQQVDRTLEIIVATVLVVVLFVGVPVFLWQMVLHRRRRAARRKERLWKEKLEACLDKLSSSASNAERRKDAHQILEDMQHRGALVLRSLGAETVEAQTASSRRMQPSAPPTPTSTEPSTAAPPDGAGAGPGAGVGCGGVGGVGAGRVLVFVITDIEGSTFLADTDAVAYREIQEVHDTCIRDALDEFCGVEINTEGDCFQCVFHRASHALSFCMRVQVSPISRRPFPPSPLSLGSLSGSRVLGSPFVAFAARPFTHCMRWH